MSDRYAVVGNPVAHSRSPSIHAQFAAQTGQDISYERLLAPLDGFVATVEAFRAGGGRGANVTLPFKLQAFEYARRRSPRAEAAGAVNTLVFEPEGVFGDNTDGVGMVRDIVDRLGFRLRGCRLLLAGAGGAARGVVQPLLQAGVASIVIANRTVPRAVELARLGGDSRVRGCGFEALDADGPAGQGFDAIVNATSTGLEDTIPAIPDAAYRGLRLAYDMVYGARPTPFMRHAARLGCPQVSDGLGMLVEQAAESFLLWRGVRPRTDAVLARLRAEIGGA